MIVLFLCLYPKVQVTILSLELTTYSSLNKIFSLSPLKQVTSDEYDPSTNTYYYCISLNVHNSDSLSIKFSIHINRYLEFRSQLFELNWNSLDLISCGSSIVPVFFNLQIFALKFKFQNLFDSQCHQIW